LLDALLLLLFKIALVVADVAVVELLLLVGVVVGVVVLVVLSSHIFGNLAVAGIVTSSLPIRFAWSTWSRFSLR